MSAPTTEEVREALERLTKRTYAGQGAFTSDYTFGYWEGELQATRHVALPLAEDRDALAAEVARLREALEIACDWWGGCEHHPDDCPQGDACKPKCKAAKRVNELAAKGAGR